ncbi:MAG: N-acetylmannosamine-6-phosphate 2-epimerase [Solirubrobacteraceae bacterium]
MRADEFRALVDGRLIVSCQAPAGHPLRDTRVLTAIARAAVAGGAAAIRCGGVGGPKDIKAIAAAVDVPIVGLTKEGSTGVYITPTVAAAESVARAGADVVAIDATRRPRPDGSSFHDAVRAVHRLGALVLADAADVEDGLSALSDGADAVATTLAGYVDRDRPPEDPDLELVTALRAQMPEAILLAEGRYHTPDLAAHALLAGATAVVVGTAITDIAWVTDSFVTHTSTAV